MNEKQLISFRKLWRRHDVAIALGIGIRLAEKLMRTNAIKSAIFGKARVTTPEHVEQYIKSIIFSEDN